MFFSEDGEADYPSKASVNFYQITGRQFKETIISVSLFLRKLMRLWKMDRRSNEYMN
jgi:hypothetical protein